MISERSVRMLRDNAIAYQRALASTVDTMPVLPKREIELCDTALELYRQLKEKSK